LQGEARVLRYGREYFDFRPGLPLHEFLVDYFKPQGQRSDTKFVGTVDQMHASRCYRESQGPDKLGCISCHDPHALPAPEAKAAYFRDRCLACHAERGCSLTAAERKAKSPEDSCIACHMPRKESSTVHLAITDHRIPRQREAPDSPAPAVWPRPGEPALVAFHLEAQNLANPENARDLGLAMVETAQRFGGFNETGATLANAALPYLDAATRDGPDDAAAWEARALALFVLRRPQEALTACEKVLALDPERETTLFLSATVAGQTGATAQATAYAERAVKVNPSMWQYHHILASAYAQAGNWEAAAAASNKAVKLDPAVGPARQLLARCYLRLGDRARAQHEFEVLLRLTPARAHDQVRRWWEQQH
jgi:tetratricopeptide (TPR) repeat protein